MKYFRTLRTVNIHVPYYQLKLVVQPLLNQLHRSLLKLSWLFRLAAGCVLHVQACDLASTSLVAQEIDSVGS